VIGTRETCGIHHGDIGFSRWLHENGNGGFDFQNLCNLYQGGVHINEDLRQGPDAVTDRVNKRSL
jgi:hypothetical protein